MLEPLIVLTVLNCIFMFSSTVTTCALWWQYHHHRCCNKKDAALRKSDLKRSKGSYTFGTIKKLEKSELDNHTDPNAIGNSNTKANREHRSKRYQKERFKKNVDYLIDERNSEEKTLPSNKTELGKSGEKRKMSEASQTINDTKSTVVMEFSTVQKVVQIVDNDSDINSTKIPFKDIVIKKDKADKKRDFDVEQNFTNNAATIQNS